MNKLVSTIAILTISLFLAADHKYILGGQANVWTEYILYPAKLEYMIFPRATALSEVYWRPAKSKNYDDFTKRLTQQFKRFDLWGTMYSEAHLDPASDPQ